MHARTNVGTREHARARTHTHTRNTRPHVYTHSLSFSLTHSHKHLSVDSTLTCTSHPRVHSQTSSLLQCLSISPIYVISLIHKPLPMHPAASPTPVAWFHYRYATNTDVIVTSIHGSMLAGQMLEVMQWTSCFAYVQPTTLQAVCVCVCVCMCLRARAHAVFAFVRVCVCDSNIPNWLTLIFLAHVQVSHQGRRPLLAASRSVCGECWR